MPFKRQHLALRLSIPPDIHKIKADVKCLIDREGLPSFNHDDHVKNKNRNPNPKMF